MQPPSQNVRYLSADITPTFDLMQVAPQKIPSHFPAIRLSVARQMADERKKFAKRLKREMAVKGFTSEKLALRSEVHSKTIGELLQGKRNAQQRTVNLLADALGVPPTRLRPPPDLEEDVLERLETMLQAIMVHLEIPLPAEDADEGELFLEGAEQAAPGDATGEAGAQSGR